MTLETAKELHRQLVIDRKKFVDQLNKCATEGRKDLEKHIKTADILLGRLGQAWNHRLSEKSKRWFRLATRLTS